MFTKNSVGDSLCNFPVYISYFPFYTFYRLTCITVYKKFTVFFLSFLIFPSLHFRKRYPEKILPTIRCTFYSITCIFLVLLSHLTLFLSISISKKQKTPLSDCYVAWNGSRDVSSYLAAKGLHRYSDFQ